MKKILSSKLSGIVRVPSSKTHIHRILYASLLKRGFFGFTLDESSYLSYDVLSTINVLQTVGCVVNYDNETNLLEIDSSNLEYNNEIIYCNACATTLRIGIIVILYLFGKARFSGTKALMSRPLTFYEKLFEENDILMNYDGNTLEVSGPLDNLFKGNKLMLDYVESSQYITGLMFVMPFFKKDISIIFNEEMESSTYLEVTKHILKNYGVYFDFRYEDDILKEIIYLKNGSKPYFKAGVSYLSPDYGLAAFWLVANEFGTNINIENKLILPEDEFIHPDQAILDIIPKVTENEPIINLKNCPDLLPIILVLFSFKGNGCKIVNFERNRIKESNRVENMIDQLNSLGANIKIYEDLIEVLKVDKIKSGIIDGYDDHRIIMSFTVASIKAEGPITIRSAEHVKKSYYKFWEDFESLGGVYEEVFE